MTVLENLQMGATVAGTRRIRRDLERVLTLFPRLNSASPSAAARCRAASSRCWRSRAR
jgi:ABC-type branched-subunit amino acid transport system ATPase component